MPEVNHTPLPWEAWEPDFPNPDGSDWCVRSDDGEFICQLCNKKYVRLLAASPDLLEAAKEALELINLATQSNYFVFEIIGPANIGIVISKLTKAIEKSTNAP